MNPQDAPSGDLTKAQYRKLRKVFENSHHDDIRTAGTRMMDVWWQMTGLGPNAGLEALPYVAQMLTAITDLRGACTHSGIVVKFDSPVTPPVAASLPTRQRLLSGLRRRAASSSPRPG